MKYVFLAIFVLLAAQPLQASLFDMCDTQGTSLAQHGDMDSMDCCDQDPTGSSDNCDPMSHCGACPTAVVAVCANPANVDLAAYSRQYLPDTGEPKNQFKSPPFRPPIA